ncbi:MAG TPA: efflux RND transporter periplasmic adaptor subunit [Burkholderiales bacterium]|nr:efflux RND transporter periplasmic adaptor subunit [Burkholderiales bacterium]
MRSTISQRQLHPAGVLARLALSATIALTLAGCGNGEKPAAAANAKPAPAIPVTVKRVEVQRVPIALEAVGQAEGSREVEIRARVSGIIEKRLYTEGAPVKAGQTLFMIDRKPFEIAVAQARAALSQERARLEQAQREAERLKPLAQSRAISQREYDDALSTARQSAAAIEGAQAKLAEAQLNLSYTDVKAPIGGITGRALRSEGSLVAANTDLLTNLTQVNPMWVRFSLAEPDFDRIRGSKDVKVNILTREGEVAAHDGRINFTGSTVDPKLGTVQLRAEFPNKALRWLPGQFLKVQILAGEQEGMLVPQRAVMQTEQARMVWVVESGKATMKPVDTANWVGSDWIVTGGLKPGEQVIVDNLIKLRPGIEVQPHEGGAPAAAAGAPNATPGAANPAAR